MSSTLGDQPWPSTPLPRPAIAVRQVSPIPVEIPPASDISKWPGQPIKPLIFSPTPPPTTTFDQGWSDVFIKRELPFTDRQIFSYQEEQFAANQELPVISDSGVGQSAANEQLDVGVSQFGGNLSHSDQVSAEQSSDSPAIIEEQPSTEKPFWEVLADEEYHHHRRRMLLMNRPHCCLRTELRKECTAGMLLPRKMFTISLELAKIIRLLRRLHFEASQLPWLSQSCFDEIDGDLLTFIGILSLKPSDKLVESIGDEIDSLIHFEGNDHCYQCLFGLEQQYDLLREVFDSQLIKLALFLKRVKNINTNPRELEQLLIEDQKISFMDFVECCTWYHTRCHLE